jgi:hypothetical protein
MKSKKRQKVKSLAGQTAATEQAQKATKKFARPRKETAKPLGNKKAILKTRKSQRSYSDKTLKELFGLSYNECAHPDCTNPIIAAGTKVSDAAVLGQICHIFAAADNGPRGKPGLTVMRSKSVNRTALSYRSNSKRVRYAGSSD